MEIKTNIIKVGDKILIPYSEYKYPNIGDYVFWLDCSYNRGEKHTSRWGIITKYDNEMCIIDCDTEVPIDELYIAEDANDVLPTLKVNASGMEESIEVKLSKDKTPIAYNNKVNELVAEGMTREEAEEWVDKAVFVMEMYYEHNNGLFLVECDAFNDNADIYSPYTQTEMKY